MWLIHCDYKLKPGQTRNNLGTSFTFVPDKSESGRTLTALTDIPSRFFASQNRMTSFTWPNRLGGSSCSAAFQLMFCKKTACQIQAVFIILRSMGIIF